MGERSVLSSLFFVRACLFGSVYSIDEFSRPVNRAGKIFLLKQYEKSCPIEGQPFLCKTISAARSGESPERAYRMKFARGGAKGEGAPLRAEEELTL